jgi:hypothetical protein
MLPVIDLGKRTLSLVDSLRRAHRCGRLVPLLQEAAAVEVIRAAAADFQIQVTDDQLQSAADAFRRRCGLTTALQTRDWLVRQHWTPLDFEDAVECDLLRELVAERIAEGRIEPCFGQAQEDFQRVHLKEIVADSEALAIELRQQFREDGACFDELARTHSRSASANVGGDLGWLCRSQLPADEAHAVFTAAVDDIPPPMLVEEGYILYHVVAFRPAELDEATSRLIQQRLFDDWLAERMAAVRIDLSWIESANGSR